MSSLITGKVANSTPVYFGPSSTTYPSQSSSAGPNDDVLIKWQEGNWYYIDYPAGSSRKCMYINKTAVTQVSATPPTFSPTLINDTMVVASNTYWGPSGSYPSSAGSVSKNEAVHHLSGKVEGGFALIEYNISGGKKKRAWVPVSRLSEYKPSSNTIVDTNNKLQTITTHPANIMLADLGNTLSLKASGLHGVNAGFFSFDAAGLLTLQIAANNGVPVRKGFPTYKNQKYYDGSTNSMGAACLTWNGTTLSYSRSTASLSGTATWAQGGIDLRLGKRLTDYESGTTTVEAAIRSQMPDAYSGDAYRTAICANLSSKEVKMVVTSEECSMPDFRSALTSILGITENGTLNNNIVAMALDGGGSSQMVGKNCPPSTNTRNLIQCMVIVS